VENETLYTIALALGADRASGINRYAIILVLGWLGATGQTSLGNMAGGRNLRNRPREDELKPTSRGESP